MCLYLVLVVAFFELPNLGLPLGAILAVPTEVVCYLLSIPVSIDGFTLTLTLVPISLFLSCGVGR